jgi:hypothetical protein
LGVTDGGGRRGYRQTSQASPDVADGAGPARAARVCDTRTAVTVNLTRIYTKRGDAGQTHLGDMSRVSKTHPRVEAYGTVDELNCHVGFALLAQGMPAQLAEWLRRIQNDLLDLGADLCVPEPTDEKAAAESGCASPRPTWNG